VRRGELVVFPTDDSVYGVGADAFSHDAVAELRSTRHQPPNSVVPVLVSSPNTLHGIVTNFSEAAWELVDAFWPGGLTLVAFQQPSLQWDIGSDRSTIMVRMPINPVALELLSDVGPMAVTSASKAGTTPPTNVDDARDQLGDYVSVYLDGGSYAPRGTSTIVDVTESTPRMVRSGVVTLQALRSVIPDIQQ
jgi:L-threonylcarbamoyladenylate synthase